MFSYHRLIYRQNYIMLMFSLVSFMDTKKAEGTKMSVPSA